MILKISQRQDPELTVEQIKAARAALNMSASVVAAETGIGVATLRRYELSQGVPKSRKGHLALLREYFEAQGIEFIGTPDDGPGIRLRRPK